MGFECGSVGIALHEYEFIWCICAVEHFVSETAWLSQRVRREVGDERKDRGARLCRNLPMRDGNHRFGH